MILSRYYERVSKTACVIEGCDRLVHRRGVCRTHYMRCWRAQMEWPDWQPAPTIGPEDRFWLKVDKGGDCWLWTASVLPNGYGQFDHTTAHRRSIEFTTGKPVPAGAVVDHLCRNRLCVNPSHLEVVTQSTNVNRGYAGPISSSMRKEWSMDRTHCKHGHELTPDNEYNPPGHPTWRQCRECRRAAASRRKRHE